MENQISFCNCGSSIPSNFTFCPKCGADAGTAMDAGFEGDDAPTRVSEPDFVVEQRVRTAKPAIGRPMPPWVPVAPRASAPPPPVERAPRPIITRPREREVAPAPVVTAAPAPSGFKSGLFLGFGIAGFLFGVLGVGVAGAGLIAVRYWQPASATAAAPLAFAPAPVATATPAPVHVRPVAEEPREVAVASTPAVIAKATPEATPAVVARVATPAPTPAIVAKPAPTPVAVARAVTPRAKAVATPRVVAAARPVATPTISPSRPSHDELLALATAARARATMTATPAPAATPAPFAEPSTDLASELSASSAAPSKPDAELDDLLGTPSTPAPAPVAKKAAPARDSGERVIHSRKGDKPVTVNANIALTRTDGKTLVGKLVGVSDGYVDVKTSDSQLRIAETDVLDAATY